MTLYLSYSTIIKPLERKLTGDILINIQQYSLMTLYMTPGLKLTQIDWLGRPYARLFSKAANGVEVALAVAALAFDFRIPQLAVPSGVVAVARLLVVEVVQPPQ